MDSLTRENYFDYGTTLDKLAITSSSLQHIQPSQGGSVLRFINYILDRDERKESISLERGSLLHKYFENPDEFKLSPETKPSEAVAEIVEDVYNTVVSSGTLAGVLSLYNMEILTSARKFQYGVAGKWGSDVIIKKVREKGDKYYEFLAESSDSIIVDAKTKTILINIMSTFENDEYLRRFIDDSLIDPEIILNKELPILFEYRGLQCKSLLDRLEIDIKNKTVMIYDYKSTSKNVGLYMGGSILTTDSNSNLIYMPTPGPFQEYRVYRQLAFYQLAIVEYLEKIGLKPNEFKFGHRVIACETIKPYQVIEHNIKTSVLAMGANEIDACFDILLQNKDNFLNTTSNYDY